MSIPAPDAIQIDVYFRQSSETWFCELWFVDGDERDRSLTLSTPANTGWPSAHKAHRAGERWIEIYRRSNDARRRVMLRPSLDAEIAPAWAAGGVG